MMLSLIICCMAFVVVVVVVSYEGDVIAFFILCSSY